MTTRAVVTLRVETVDPYGWDVGQWDVDNWAPAAAVATDVTCFWQGASIAGGRNGPMDRFRAAHCDLRLDNRDGRFDSWSDLTPFAPDGIRHLGAGAVVEVAVTVDGADPVPLFTGTASTWHMRRDGPDRWVEVGADDALAFLPAANLPEQPSQGAGEHAGARLARILAAHGLEVLPTRFDVGVVALQATTLAQDALTLADLAADSDGGWLWVDGAGVLVFYQADHDAEDPRWTAPVLTFTDTDTDPAPAVCWATLELDDDADAIVNHVEIAAAGGTAVIQEDTGSRQRFGTRTFQRHDLMFDPASNNAQVIGTKVLDRLAAGGTRPGRVAVTARSDVDAARLIGLQWHDRVRVVAHNVDVLAVDAYLDAYAWALVPMGSDDGACAVGFEGRLSPAVAYVTAGRWDRAAWDVDPWGY